MKCEDVKINLEPYTAGELSNTEKKQIENHLKKCNDCKKELDEIKQKKEWVINVANSGLNRMPSELENKILSMNKKNTSRKPRTLKYILAASLAIIVLVTTIFGSAIAKFTEDIPFINKYFSFGDKGIIESLKKGAGQVIEETKKSNGVSVTVHRLIADANRTIILFSADNTTGDPVDNVHIKLARIIGENGKAFDQSAGYNMHDESNSKATGKIETVGVDSLGNNIKVMFEQISFRKKYTREFEFDSSDDLTGKKIMLNNDHGYLTVESTDIKGDNLSINLIPHIEKENIGNYVLKLYNSEQKVIPGGTMYGSNSSKIECTYNLENVNEPQFKAVFQYKKQIAVTNEQIAFDIEVDKTLAKKSTYVKQLDKKIELEKDLYLSFEEITSTASQTAIRYSVNQDKINELNRSNFLDFDIYSNGEKVYYNIERNNRSLLIKLDPTIPLDALKIKIKGYYKLDYAKIPLQIKQSDTGKNIVIGDVNLTVKDIHIDQSTENTNFVRIALESDEPVRLNSATVSDAAGNTRNCHVSYYKAGSSGKMVNTISFEAGRKDKWNINIKTHEKYYKNNVEIEF